MDLSTTYWLNWRVLLCTLWILTSIALAAYVIKKYEWPRQEEEEEDDRIRVLHEDEVWMTYRQQISPGWLMGYRICAFIVVFYLIIVNAKIVHRVISFYFYTQWTIALSFIYFWTGIILSAYGRYRHRCEDLDEEQARVRMRRRRVASYIFQIMYQIWAGAVVLTNCLYWFIIVPNEIKVGQPKRDKIYFITKNLYASTIVLFLGEAALNNIPFHWFRIAYFGLWTCMYVVSQWIFHACRAGFGWPYFFLNLRYPLAPLSYFLVALSHFLCYGVIYVLIKLKHFLWMKFIGY